MTYEIMVEVLDCPHHCQALPIVGSLDEYHAISTPFCSIAAATGKGDHKLLAGFVLLTQHGSHAILVLVGL